jgi:hypothetical protein
MGGSERVLITGDDAGRGVSICFLLANTDSLVGMGLQGIARLMFEGTLVNGELQLPSGQRAMPRLMKGESLAPIPHGLARDLNCIEQC